jgi:hypothetical protein
VTRGWVLLMAALVAAPAAGAAQLSDWLRIDGYADLRLIRTGDEASWRQGGAGRLRWGAAAAGPRTLLRGEGALVPVVRLGGDVDAVATLRLDGGQPAAFGLAEGFLRWRPAPIADWRFGARAGFLIPPFSLSNDGIAWTTRGTLTWSAIDSWLGEEVRGAAVEPRVEYWFDGRDRLEFTAALFTGNDPAGTILSARGWALHDQLAITSTRLRGPAAYDDIVVRRPTRTHPFVELDGRPGWYAQLAAAREDVGRVALGHYDNLADPRAVGTGVAGWRTRFTTLGAQLELPDGATVLAAQGMKGYTALRVFAPVGTVFESIYATATHALAPAHRITARWDWFRIDNDALPTALYRGELGQAATVAYVWRPSAAWRVTIEAVHVRAGRHLRTPAPAAYTTHELQLQAGLRFFF